MSARQSFNRISSCHKILIFKLDGPVSFHRRNTSYGLTISSGFDSRRTQKLLLFLLLLGMRGWFFIWWGWWETRSIFLESHALAKGLPKGRETWCRGLEVKRWEKADSWVSYALGYSDSLVSVSYSRERPGLGLTLFRTLALFIFGVLWCFSSDFPLQNSAEWYGGSEALAGVEDVFLG